MHVHREDVSGEEVSKEETTWPAACFDVVMGRSCVLDIMNFMLTFPPLGSSNIMILGIPLKLNNNHFNLVNN